MKPDRRVVTVLFADIVGSTRMVATADPEDASDQLSGILDLLEHQVRRFGGTLCQTMGDGILAVFGAPDAVEDHGVRACLAADAIVRSSRRDSRMNCAVRVGVCSGEILWDASAMSGSTRPPAVGRTVHAAAKLQQSAPANSVRVADSTAALARAWVHLEPCGEISLSPGDVVRTHSILGTFSRRRRPDDETPLVGRDAEVSLLTTAIDVTWVGRGRTIILSGPPGIGKTHMAQRLVSIAQRRGLRVMEWQMHSVRPVGAPDALTELVETVFERDIPEDRSILVTMLVAGGISTNRAEAMADMLLPAQRRPGRDPQGLLNLSAEGVGEMLGAAAADEPLMLLIEDLHWAGSDDCVILNRIAGIVAQTSLLILATSRSEQTDLPHTMVHRLDAMEPPAVQRLLEMLVGSRPELDELKASISARAQGNPYFLTECVRALRADGILVGTAGDDQLGRDGMGRLPETVQALLTSRIDSLARPQRELLLAAAVIGKTFDAGLLAAAVGRSLQDVTELLADIAIRGLIDPTRLLPRLEYTFRHALLQEAAYATLTRKDRKALHTALARTLDANPAFVDMHNRLGALAEHAFRAEWWSKAVEAGISAGSAALQQSRASEAAVALNTALRAELLDHGSITDPEKRIDLRLTTARAFMALGRIHAADKLLSDAAVLAVRAQDLRREIAALLMQCSFEWVYGRLDRSIELGQQALTKSAKIEESGEPHFELMDLVTGPLLERGRVDAALKLLERAARISAKGLQEHGRYMILRAEPVIQAKLAVAKALKGDPTWRVHIDQAIAEGDSSSSLSDRVLCRLFSSEALVLVGAYPEAERLCEEAKALVDITGFHVPMPIILARLGFCKIRRKQKKAGFDLINDALRFAEKRNAPLYLARVLYYKAAGYYQTGERSEAVSLARQALALSESCGNVPRTISLLMLLSSCSTGTDRDAYYARAKEQARQYGLSGLPRVEQIPEKLSITP